MEEFKKLVNELLEEHKNPAKRRILKYQVKETFEKLTKEDQKLAQEFITERVSLLR